MSVRPANESVNARTAVARLIAVFCCMLATVGPGFCGAGTAWAGYGFFMTPVADPGIDPSVGGDWVSYILGVSSNDGSRIGAVDVDLKGLFHQRWNWEEDAQSYGSTPSSLNVAGKDSHLLPISGALFAVAPTEDLQDSASYGSLPDVPGAIDYGVGTRLRGVWGIPGGNATSLNLAYVEPVTELVFAS